jgi:glycosyltransferase involved in cell wall biosynthesis
MKILMVSRWLWEERRRNGDTPGFFGELAQAITSQGVDLTILSQAPDAGADPEARPVDGLKMHVFSREGRNPSRLPFDKLIKLWSGYRKASTDASVIRRFEQQQGPFDVVVAQCEEPDGLACALAARSDDFPPLVTFVHDLRYKFSTDVVRFTRKSSLGFVFRKSTRVVANSTQTASWLEDEYAVPRNKIGECRIHLTAPFLNRARNFSEQSVPMENRILFLGALNRKKAPDIFLRAAISIAAELSSFTFVLVGPETTDDPSFRKEIQDLAADPALAGRIEITGRLAPEAVIGQIRRARVVVCPSRIETFSRTTVEALALGLPVIVTDTTGAAHWVKSTKCGSVIKPNDPHALVRAILDWASRENIPNASALVASELTASRAAEDWIRQVRLALA